MVDAITPVSAAAASHATRVDSSISITSEPDNAWIAARQSHITAGLLGLKEHADREKAGDDYPRREAEADIAHLDDRHPHKPHDHEASERDTDEEAEHPTLSGESERIGTWNFDDDTPFGERSAIV